MVVQNLYSNPTQPEPPFNPLHDSNTNFLAYNIINSILIKAKLCSPTILEYYVQNQIIAGRMST